MISGTIRGITLPRAGRLTYNGINRPLLLSLQRSKWMLARKPSQNVNKRGRVIVEDHNSTDSGPKSLVELKHHLRTRDLPKESKIKHFRETLPELINFQVEDQWADDFFTTIDAVFMHFYRENGVIDFLLPREHLFVLFDKTARFNLDSGRSNMPRYMSILAQKFTWNESPPTSVLLSMIEMGSRAKNGGLSASLAYILQSKSLILKPEFIAELLERLKRFGPLVLDTYKSILTAAESTTNHQIINDDFVWSFVSHVQEIFADSNPRIHEYLDANKNLQRVQFLSNKIIHAYLEVASVDNLLHLLKLKADLNSVYTSEGDSEALNAILQHLEANGVENGFSILRSVLFAQDLHDESLVKSLLSQSAKDIHQYESLLSDISDFVISNEQRYSDNLRLQCMVWKSSLEKNGTSPDVAFAELKQLYDPFVAESECHSVLLTDILQATSTFQIDDTQKLLDLICEDFMDMIGVELSIGDYKIMIDRALAHNERDLAFSLFEESLKTSSVHWRESVDPSVASTLDNLVISLTQTNKSIVDVFPRFKLIKQHMFVSCTAVSLQALTEKMLAEACVGDVIELLKRELPAIEKDSYKKIRLDLPYCVKYQSLFQSLYRFVVTYKEDKSFETNWVLYGELHRYFHIPSKTYLPVIEFFCEADRLNAALLIVRRMKMLSELHADTNINPPPQRAIYTYLLRVFGDKLYEEGVIEIHEFLKMDTNIHNQNIEMQNAILNAYSNLQNIGKARDLFLTISSNPKQQGGINEETAQIMLKTYTYSGLPYVKKFWNNLSSYGIFPDHNIFKQYLIAHTYHGHIEEAVRLVEEIDDYNLEFSSDLLLSMYNYCVEPEKQEEVEKWASQHYTEKWEELVQGGLLKPATPYMPEKNLIASGHEE